MARLLSIILLVSAVCCQDLPSGVFEDLLNFIFNGIITPQDCSTTIVLRSNIEFILYTQSNPENGIIPDNTNLQEVNPNNRYIFIIHGWLQSGSQGWIIQMKDVYLSVADANIIVVNWASYSGINYAASYCAVPLVGAIVGDFIYNVTTGDPTLLNNTQINGFSLGAHVGGVAGQEVQTKTNGSKVGRINGLDAGGPLFVGASENKRLDKNDAWFVQAIHTNNNQFGYAPRYGTVDFQVNKLLLTECGALQNGCLLFPGVPLTINITALQPLLPILFCNHIRAVAYFIESIKSGNFLGIHCDSCADFAYVFGKCYSSRIIVMGEYCPSTAVTGKYYLNTNPISPFARGTVGTKGYLLL